MPGRAGLLLLGSWFFLTSSLSWAQALLENPSPGSFQSGISVISGWKCVAAGTITVQFDDRTPEQAAYGTSRPDVKQAGACPSESVGFGLLFNYNRLGDGTHTVRVFDNSVQFGSATFTVTIPEGEFLRGASGTCVVQNFPSTGQSVILQWQEPNQNFAIVSGAPQRLTVSGRLLNNPSDRLPVPSPAAVTSEFGEEVRVAPDGVFRVNILLFPPSNKGSLVTKFADGKQNIYGITVNPIGASGGAEKPSSLGESTSAALVSEVAVELFADPVAATTDVAGVTVSPSIASPGGTATITDPQDDGIISCLFPPPADCRFRIRGTASPLLGQPGTQFRLFVGVRPVSPGGGAVFPQFPPVSVDPQTGAWLAEAQIGGGTSPAREGDLFEILAFVTSENLQAGKPEALHFDRPVDIPGVVFISPFVDLTVGAR